MWNVGVKNFKVIDWVIWYVVDFVSVIIKCRIMLKFKDINGFILILCSSFFYMLVKYCKFL